MDGTDGDRTPEVVLEQASPLAARLAEFRTGADKPAAKPQASTGDEESATGEEEQPTPEGEEVPPGTGEEQEEEEEDDETAEERKPGEGDEDVEEDADADADQPKEKLYALDIPTVGAEKDGTHAKMLRLEGLPQEFRDNLLGHVKRSQQLDGVLQRLETAREQETVARFYESDPLNAIRLVSVEHPKLAEEFVASWAIQNPKAILAIVRSAKLDTEDAEKLDLKGKVAHREMVDALSQAYGTLEAQEAVQAFRELATGTVQELADPLQLSAADTVEFAERAASWVTREMQARQAKRQSPYLTKTELVTLLQPLVQKMTGSPGGAKPAGKKPLTKEEMAARQAKADTFRRLQPGATRTGVKPTGTKKTRLPRDMGERIKLLRANKL